MRGNGTWGSSFGRRTPRNAKSMYASPSPIELLELDVDLRMASLWEDVAEVDEWDDDIALALMRAAYAKGYADALSEDEPGLLCREHRGLARPRKRGLRDRTLDRLRGSRGSY